MPDLDFKVVEAEVLPYAAGPTLLFKLAIKNAVPEEQIHSVMLRVQIRIEATKRTYDAQTKARLRELFGDPEQFGSTVKSLHWTNVVQTVPPFKGSIVTDLPVVCTYDFDVVGAKYLYALEDGNVPLLFLFSGTVLYSCEGAGLQIAQISWEKEAPYRMPIQFWKETMERYFPNSAWIRVRKDVFDRLYQYKGRNTLLTWEDVFERLLQNEPEGEQTT
ncbi:MAG: hypothetical protein JWL77_5245 [Chthonomonadaceae bacterium]|jgi:hypothetical protein|nr:hypothetical protein [Chthonomonadaceae bacterium]